MVFSASKMSPRIPGTNSRGGVTLTAAAWRGVTNFLPISANSRRLVDNMLARPDFEKAIRGMDKF